MKQIFVLSKKDLEFSRFEVLRLYKPKSYEISGHLLVIDTDKDYSARLAYTNEVYNFLFEAKKEEIEEKVKTFGWQKICKESFSARVINKIFLDEKRLGGIIYDRLKNPKVDLKNPKTKIVFFEEKDKILCGMPKSLIDKSFLFRKPHQRPELHPTSLSPQLARAAVNLTGKSGKRLLDPFCGSGGILIEAGLMGFGIAGCDIDKAMINRCRKNLEYYGIKNYSLKVFDATDIDEKFDCIVTDLPYGKSSKISQNLENLYRKFLKKAFLATDVAIVLFPDFVNYKKMIGRWKVKKEFSYYLHRSLSKRIVVLEK